MTAVNIYRDKIFHARNKATGEEEPAEITAGANFPIGSDEKKCPVCNTVNFSYLTRCRYCKHLFMVDTRPDLIKKCSKCGEPNSALADKCDICGAALSDQQNAVKGVTAQKSVEDEGEVVRCSECHEPLPNQGNVKTCPHCGVEDP
nr:zinc ribbon domain-containing protein [Candidatus Sigynarchaeota archaeon]